MLIGYPSYPMRPLEESIKWNAKNGFDFIDIFLEANNTPENINVKKCKALLKKHKLKTIGHTAWYIPIGSALPRIRKACVEELKSHFYVFKELGVEYITVHANWAGGSFFSLDQKIEFQVDTLKGMVKEAKKHGLKIMYEHTPSSEDTIQNISKILSKVKNLYFHLDIGHANINNTPIEFIKKFHKKLVHVHLHDNRGKRDEHLPMGCGTIDWEDTLKTLKKYYNGTITLEVFVKDQDYVLFTKEKLKKLWKRL